MAAEVNVRIVVEADGLGSPVWSLPKKFTDTNTPDDYRPIETVLSTTAILLSTIVNIPCSELNGLMLIARDGNVYVNTISTAISTAGDYIPDGQAILKTFAVGNSCKVALKGDDADTAITGFCWSTVT